MSHLRALLIDPFRVAIKLARLAFGGDDAVSRFRLPSFLSAESLTDDVEAVEPDPRWTPPAPKGAPMLATFRGFLGAAAGTYHGFLNLDELYRSILTALGSGSFLGLALTLLQAILANAATIFPQPATGALATTLLTLVVDLLRRLGHGPARAT